MTRSQYYVVDDDPVFVTVFEKLLRRNNYTDIMHFNSGEKCLDMLMQEEKHPSMVFLDFSLNGLNGLDVLKRIKKLNKKIKVAIVTSLDDQEIREKCLSAGAFMFINKKDIAIKIPPLFKDKSQKSFFDFSRLFLN